MRIRMTTSQKASLGALLVGLASIVADNTPTIVHAYPEIHWLTPALSFAALLITSAARSLTTSNSGTGGGPINSGPDLKATPTTLAPTDPIPPAVALAPAVTLASAHADGPVFPTDAQKNDNQREA